MPVEQNRVKKNIQKHVQKSAQKKLARNNHTVRRGGPCMPNLRPLNSNLPHLIHNLLHPQAIGHNMSTLPSSLFQDN